MVSLYRHCNKFYIIVGDVKTEVLEPVKWDGVNIIMKRDPKTHSISYELTDGEIMLEFDCKAGKSILETLYNSQGNDANAQFEAGYYDAGVYTIFYTGRFNFNTYEIDNTFVTIGIERVTKEDTVRTRFETKVRLDTDETFDGQPLTPLVPLETLFHSKAIQKTYEVDVSNPDPGVYSELNLFYFGIAGIGGGGGANQFEEKTFYLQFSDKEVKLSELEEVFSYPLAFNTNEPLEKLRVTEAGDYTIDISLIFQSAYGIPTQTGVSAAELDCGTGLIEYTRSRLYLKIYDKDDVIKHTVLLDEVDETDCTSLARVLPAQTIGYLNTFSLDVGDKVKIYPELYISGTYNRRVSYSELTFSPEAYAFGTIKITGETTVNSSNVKTYLIHEATNRVLEVITGETNPLKSDFFGRVDLGYAADGCGSKNLFTNGFNIRAFANRAPQISLKNIFEGANALYWLGMGFEYVGGVEKVVIERAPYFYQNNEIIIINNALNYKETADKDNIYNEVHIGFNKYPEDEVNTLDEFLTKHEYLLPIKTKKDKLEILCPFVLSGYIIEIARRLQFDKNSTVSNQYDEDIFLIAANRYLYDTVNFVAGTNDIQFNFDIGLSIGQSFRVISRHIDAPLSAGNSGVFTVTNIVNTLPAGFGYVVTVSQDITNNETEEIVVFADSLPWKPETNESFQSIVNLISPETAYNLRHSIKRMLFNWAGEINSGLRYKATSEIIRFTAGLLNYELKTQFRLDEPCLLGDADRALVSEGDDITILENDQAEKIFSPETISFEAPLTWEQIDYIRKAHQNQSPDANNYGYISVYDDKNQLKKGYLMQLDYNPVEAICKFVLRKKYIS